MYEHGIALQNTQIDINGLDTTGLDWGQGGDKDQWNRLFLLPEFLFLLGFAFRGFFGGSVYANACYHHPAVQ